MAGFKFTEGGAKKVVRATKITLGEGADNTGVANRHYPDALIVTGFSSDDGQGNSQNPCNGVSGFSGQSGVSGCCPGEYAQLSHQICFDKYGFDLSAAGDQDRIASTTVYNTGLLACTLSQVGGDGGDDTHGPSWLYDVYDANTGEKVGSSLSPDYRIFTTEANAATGGLYRVNSSGDADLWFAFESGKLDDCSSGSGSA